MNRLNSTAISLNILAGEALKLFIISEPIKYIVTQTEKLKITPDQLSVIKYWRPSATTEAYALEMHAFDDKDNFVLYRQIDTSCLLPHPDDALSFVHYSKPIFLAYKYCIGDKYYLDDEEGLIVRLADLLNDPDSASLTIVIAENTPYGHNGKILCYLFNHHEFLKTLQLYAHEFGQSV